MRIIDKYVESCSEKIMDEGIVKIDSSIGHHKNRKFAGPSETWPAQVEDMIHNVSLDYNVPVTYENLKGILLKESPISFERKYLSEVEARCSFYDLFEGVILGLYKGRLEREFQDNLSEVGSGISNFRKPFVNLKKKALGKGNFLEKLENFYEHCEKSSYHNVWVWCGFDYSNMLKNKNNKK